MLKIVYDVEKARATLLRRSTLEMQETPLLGDKMVEVFDKPMSVQEVVARILSDVRLRGDEAVRDLELKLDGVKLNQLEVSKREITRARSRVDPKLVSALEFAAQRIEAFHSNCRRQSWINFCEGGMGQWIRPLEKVGVYVPGGRASYPSTLLMTAIPARVAGVKEIIVTSPPAVGGTISATTLLAAEIVKADRVFKMGGAQAVAALAFGTETIPKVDKICGPGNIFVQLAKKMLYGTVGIDGFYGPTETIVVADDTANPVFCAADLLAQAEHDVMASAILITTSARVATAVSRQVDDQLKGLDRRQMIQSSLGMRGGIIVVPDVDTAVSLVNEYAPEHVSLMVKDAWAWAEKIKNAGGIFVGEDSPEVVGDYIAGPSHVMPTGGTARFSSPVTVEDFLKVTSVVAVDRKTLQKIGSAAATIARVEGLDAHSRAVELRLAKKRRKEK